MKIAEMKVELLDHMGSDLSVVNAARVSFDKTSEWDYAPSGTIHAGEIFLSGKDAKLIRYLAHHDHWSPFAHTSIQLRVKAPIFVARQLVKHQVGGVWNEVSRRYVDSEPEFWFPNTWRGRPEGSMKQGSSGVVADAGKCLDHELYTGCVADCVELAFDSYQRLLDKGVAPEQARMILPQNMMTEWIWTGSLMFFTRVCKLRLDEHSQQETRDIAERIAEVVAPLFPVSWSALMEN